MLHSSSGRAAVAGCALLLWAVPALAAEPLAQPWTSPLDSAVLGDVTADRGLAAALPLPVPAETNYVIETTNVELPRPTADTWTSLDGIEQPAPRDFAGTSQTATNIALSITLDGVAAFASVRQ